MRVEDKYLRQLDLINPKDLIPTVVVGAGTIGSWTTLGLAKMGVKHIEVFDNDRVEWHNLPNQIYEVPDIGHEKVSALKNYIESLYDLDIIGRCINLTNESIIDISEPFIVISAVDSMESRKVIFDKFKDNYRCKFLIDGRVGRDFCMVYTVNMRLFTHPSRYEYTLHDDDMSFIQNEEIRTRFAEVPCTEGAVIDLSFLVSSAVLNRMRNVLSGKQVPFATHIDLTNGYIENEK